MNSEPKNDGFSLTEVLLAVGILAVGMIFIAGVFPVGIHFTTIATERTQAAVVADEAFAKVRLYGVYFDPTWLATGPTTTCFDFNDVLSVDLNPNEFAYPSTDTGITQKQYYWSALCRRVDLTSRLVQVTVFVSRKIGADARYRDPANPPDNSFAVPYPMPVPVDVDFLPSGRPDELLIVDVVAGFDEATLINDGYTIVDNQTGQLYRVLERYPSPDDRIILLDRPWQGGDLSAPLGWIWVIPPPVNGGRYPCISVFQKVIRF